MFYFEAETTNVMFWILKSIALLIRKIYIKIKKRKKKYHGIYLKLFTQPLLKISTLVERKGKKFKKILISGHGQRILNRVCIEQYGTD